MSERSPDVERLREFDDQEWMRVERLYAGRLMAYVSRRVPDLQAREDIVQESFLGAVRGIAAFDPVFTFEQYLFGICRNRTIDHLRRRNATPVAGQDGEQESSMFENLATNDETPSAIFRREDLQGRGRELLAQVLREWVQETWQAGEFQRLKVIESLFRGGWRNRDAWQYFELRDETAVAGIKFRALKRMRQLAARHDESGMLLPALADEAGHGRTDMDVATIWRQCKASCPARHWLARWIAGTLDKDPSDYLKFHLDVMSCELCQANRDDLAAREEALEPLLERLQASTAALLRSRGIRDPQGDSPPAR